MALLLRLMGAGRTLREAIRDLLALPADAWERSLALPWLVRLRFEIPTEPSARSAEEEAIIVEIQEWFEQYQQRLRREGRDEGRAAALAHLIAKRLGRALSDSERATVADRLHRLGEDRLDDVLLTFDAAALSAWLSDPGAS